MNKFCIIGLGNPGEKYQKTRHNIGFRVLDNFLQSRNPEGKFSSTQKHSAETAVFSLKENKLFIAKPQTFMNNSGNAVRSILEYYDMSAEKNLLLIHDDIDLPFGKIRFSKDSGPAGHNGVSSVINQVGTQNFIRLRFGITEPFPEKDIPTETFVLKNFNSEEEKELPKLIDQTSNAIESFLENGFSLAASKYNQK